MLIACDGKDVAYYELHVDEAKGKLVECSYNNFSASMLPSELTDLIFKDKECEAARNARLAEKRIKLQQLQQRADGQSRSEYQTKKRQLLAMSYLAFVELESTCGWADVSPVCQAARDVQDDMLSKEVARLKQAYSGAALNQVKADACRGGATYVQALCNVAEIALGQQQTQRVSYYLTNQSAFKQEYNACRIELLANNAIHDDDAIAQYMSGDHQCALVAKAANLIGLHDFSQPL
ncbi:hypothetical protein K6Y31_04895 [Motilimonas cestriensis]|uniref:Lipoprotein n=1 Tax=Motilimonas cestriensis TaxID=2742685 RepID=A0ABS8W7R3_9GAMM|nr:hypothetical protein [Motilimonas cestriensis]MCE2594147.1 hypothetical protein [Motilimonas cestriensis]